jgi:hypothetical protein
MNAKMYVPLQIPKRWEPKTPRAMLHCPCDSLNTCRAYELIEISCAH